jgi:membrane-associated phospholipid phosphatase
MTNPPPSPPSSSPPAVGSMIRRLRPLLPPAMWLALLGPMFFLVYGWCNAFTSQRADVGSCFFEWERRIPFVPVMIIPYMSIDLFFAGSFFLCRDRAQLRTHAARIALAIGISAAGFLLFPLRYGWARPAVDGWLGAVFAPLNALDQPYNLCPSLHISLRTILWQVYGRSLDGRRWLRGAVWGWFVLIGVSTLLVYQHHVIDLLGGYLVAVLCCRLFPEKVARPAPAAAISPGAQDENSSPPPPPSPPSPTCPPTSSTLPPPPAWPSW